MIFYLGTHQPDWLAKTDVPLFVARQRLARYKALPRAVTRWALDSGAFSEIQAHGAWTVSPAQYVAEARRFRDEVGMLDWAASMDWMCEPHILAKTGKTVEEHQRLSLDNYLELRQLAPEVPWVPCLQGWTVGDYWRHAEAYERAGVRLASLPLVGVGSVCRRQGTARAVAMLATLAAADGLKLHGFGFKLQGLKHGAAFLASADSLAWSYDARRAPALEGCPHKSCNSCLRYALKWRLKALAAAEEGALMPVPAC